MSDTFYLPKNKEEFVGILQKLLQDNNVFKNINNIKNKESPKILTRIEAAEFLNISLPTLNKLTKEKKIAASKLGNRVLYQQSSLDEALNESKIFKLKK